MTTPTITPYTGDPPAKEQSNSALDTNVDYLLDYMKNNYVPEISAFITWTNGVANSVLATALAGDLPDPTGNALSFIRANAAEDGGEFRTPAQVRSDIGANNASNLSAGTVPFAHLPISSIADWTRWGAQLSDRATTKLFVDAAILASVAANSLGVGQSWSTPTRSTGTIYRNTTGRTISVALLFQDSSGNRLQVSTTGAFSGEEVTLARSSSSNILNAYTTISPMDYYKVTGGVNTGDWAESR